jgi:hypothetical protein
MPKEAPKRSTPWRDWRENVREFAIVLAGVFVALVAQQAVEAWDWHRKVDVAEAAMRDELLYDDGPQIYQRVVMHPCVVARLQAISDAVDAGKDRQEIGRQIDGYWIDVRGYDRLALDAANASDVASHMNRDEMEPYLIAYETMPLMTDTNVQEGFDIGRMRAFTRSGGAMSQEEKDRLLQAVEALRNEENTMWAKARLKMYQLRKIGPLDAGRVQMFMADARQHYGACVKDLPPDFPAGVPH